jgi:hypothetical protein
MDNVTKVMDLIKQAYAIYGTLTKDERIAAEIQINDMEKGEIVVY